MKEVLRGRHLINFDTWTRQEIDTVLELTSDLKIRHAMGEPHGCCRTRRCS